MRETFEKTKLKLEYFETNLASLQTFSKIKAEHHLPITHENGLKHNLLTWIIHCLFNNLNSQ